MPRKPKKPSNKKLNGFTLNARRGPDAENRWYWRVFWWGDAAGDGARTRGSRNIGWLTVEEADRAFAETANADQAPEQEVQTPAKAKLEHLLRAWLHRIEQRGDLASKTKDNYRKSVVRLIEVIGDVRLTRLTFPDLEDYRDQKVAQGSPRTVEQDFKILRMAWRWGRRAGHVADRPLTLPKVSIQAGVYFVNHRTPPDREVEASLSEMNGWHRDAVVLLWASGARCVDIQTLSWSQVDLAGGWVSFYRKNNPRKVPLTDEALAVLEARKKTSTGEQVFTEITEVASWESSLRSAIQRACKAAEVQEWTPHGLRRLAVDEMARSGVDIATACAITGHCPEVMIRHYRTVTDDDKRAALAKAKLGRVRMSKVIKFPGTGTDNE